eukprot:snap_masked-scaffold_14-processed-gene-5.20-mRNA-1 protein AED:1.00 eAED:1.00 QI:0/-1/0/0/-1/1/1/0/335
MFPARRDEKRCAQCHEDKPLSAFSKNQRKKYKEKARCKSCVGGTAEKRKRSNSVSSTLKQFQTMNEFSSSKTPKSSVIKMSSLLKKKVKSPRNLLRDESNLQPRKNEGSSNLASSILSYFSPKKKSTPKSLKSDEETSNLSDSSTDSVQNTLISRKRSRTLSSEKSPKKFKSDYATKNQTLLSSPSKFLSKSNTARIPQSADGMCLFHSLSYGLNNFSKELKISKLDARRLRSILVDWELKNAEKNGNGMTLLEWARVEHDDSTLEMKQYCNDIRRGSWGGQIELFAASKIYNVQVNVYTVAKNGYKLFTTYPGKKHRVNVLYVNGNHYDALRSR